MEHPYKVAYRVCASACLRVCASTITLDGPSGLHLVSLGNRYMSALALWPYTHFTHLDPLAPWPAPAESRALGYLSCQVTVQVLTLSRTEDSPAFSAVVPRNID